MTVIKNRASFYIKLIFILLASFIVIFLYSIKLVIETSREIKENHIFIDDNFLTRTESLNRLIFTLSDLLLYDEKEIPIETIIQKKLEKCSSVIKSSKYILNIKPNELNQVLQDDPLLIKEQMKIQNKELSDLILNLKTLYAKAKQSLDLNRKLEYLSAIEEEGVVIMGFLKKHNYLLMQFDDYLYTHLKEDLIHSNEILYKIILVHSILTLIIIAVSLLYYFASIQIKLELIDSRDNLEILVNERTNDLSTKQIELESMLDEKEYLLKEVHHRVKNNLNIIESLISIEKENNTNEDFNLVLSDIISRIQSISLVHKKIYQSDSLSKVDFKEYVEDLSNSIISSFTDHNIKVEISMEPVQFNSKTAVPLGIIIAELTTNAIKYGFRNKSDGTLSFDLVTKDNNIVFKIFNNGEPFPESIDFRASGSLGLTLVCGMVSQIAAEIELDKTNGTLFTISIPEKN